jgi:hypothetical protein
MVVAVAAAANWFNLLLLFAYYMHYWPGSWNLDPFLVAVQTGCAVPLQVVSCRSAGRTNHKTGRRKIDRRKEKHQPLGSARCQ